MGRDDMILWICEIQKSHHRSETQRNDSIPLKIPTSNGFNHGFKALQNGFRPQYVALCRVSCMPLSGLKRGLLSKWHAFHLRRRSIKGRRKYHHFLGNPA